MSKKTVFTGAGCAIATPMFADGSINYDELARLIEFQIENKTDAIVICGTTGESSTMTDDEHAECIRFAVEKVNHRVPVLRAPAATIPHTQFGSAKRLSRQVLTLCSK